MNTHTEKIKINLQNIKNCDSEVKENIRKIRNKDFIRKAMYSENIISVEEHAHWLKNIDDEKNLYFAISVNDLTTGMVSFNFIDKHHKKTDWAFYLNDTSPKGLGAAIEFWALDYAFNKLGMKKLNCEVIEKNIRVVEMHKKFGFIEEGFRRSNIVKETDRQGIYFLGITENEWCKNRPNVMDKIFGLVNKFHITLSNE